MSDAAERARDYDERVAQAGGPTALIAELVDGVRQYTFLTRVLVVGLALDFILTLGFAGLYFVARSTDHRSAANQRAIAHAQVVACQHSNDTGEKMNALISSLVVAVGQTPYLPAAEKARRIATYNADRAARQKC